MRKLLTLLFILLSLVAYPTTYYVSLTGSDSNVGSFASPFYTWQKGFSTAQPGDTVYFRGGVYYPLARIVNDPEATPAKGYSGTESDPIVYMSYPGEWAILDCHYHDSTSYNYAILLNYVEHIVLKNFEVRNVYQYNGTLTGAISATYSRNLTFDHIVIHNVSGRGFYVLSGAWKSFYDDGKTATAPYWDTEIDTTRWINCDVYDICDSLSVTGYPPTLDPGNGGDCWKTVHYRGNVVYWEGCRGWDYSDDFVDPTLGNGAITYFNNCWAMSSNKYDIEGFDHEGNGFKLPAPNYNSEVRKFNITNCLAIFCPGIGFANNLLWNGTTSWDARSVFYNNTSYGNGIGMREIAPTDSVSKSVWRNNISFSSTTLTATGKAFNWGSNASYIAESNNTFDFYDGYPGFEETDTVTVTDADFIGLDGDDTADSTYLVAMFTAPRQADGSLPVQRPLMLAEGSDLIDAGIQVPAWDSTDYTITYLGSSPDIGYSEYGTTDETATDILSFTFANIVGVAVVNTTTHTVTAVLQAGEDISAVTPTFTLSSGATSDPASGVEDDYTNPVTITVTAEDEVTEQEWTVTITLDDDPVPTVATVGTVSADYNAVSANITGRIYSANGGTLTARGICWSTTSTTPSLTDKHTTYTPYVGTFTDKIYGLRGGVTYYFRAYATTSEGGTSYGGAVSITTPPHSIINNSSTGRVYTIGGVPIIIR